MAQFIKHFVQDLQQDIKIRECGTFVFNADNESNVITVDLYNGQASYSGGGSVIGACICPDGSTVPLTGSLSGNTASITLIRACFAIPGQIGVGIQVVVGDVKTTVLKAIYNVELFDTDTVVDPDERITISVSDLIDDINQAIATIPADYTDLMAAVAPTFSDSKAYNAGQYVWYDGKLYKFSSDHIAGSWTGTPPTDAVLIALGDDITYIRDVTITKVPGNAVQYTANENGVRWRHISTGWQKTQTAATAYNHAVTFPVTAGKTYRVSGRHTAYTPLATFWTATSTEPVGCSQDGYASDQTNEDVTLDILIPQDVTYIIVTGYPLDVFPTVYAFDDIDKGVYASNELSKSVDFRISGNIFDSNNYTVLADASGYYYLSSVTVLGKLRGIINYTSGDSVRTISVPCRECKRYMIQKTLASVMRVTSGALEWPNYSGSGVTFSNYDQNSGANTEPLYIETRPGDHYLYIQLFVNADTNKTLSDYLPGLSIYEVANSVSDEAVGFIEKRKLIEPYAFGAVNQVARLGWGTTIANAPPIQSIPSYKLALQNGVKIMLADVRVTQDGCYVCAHDDSLNGSRIYIIDNGVARPIVEGDPEMTVSGSTIAQIDASRDFGAYKGAAYTGMKLLRLEEFLQWCALTNCVPFLEQKVEWTSTQITEIASLVKKYRLDDYCVIEENREIAHPSLWHSALPKCKYVIGGGTNYSDAITQAVGLITAGHDSSDVFVGITNPGNLTAEQLATIRSNGIHMWYTEIQSYSDFDTLLTNGYFDYYTLISCSYFNLYDYMYTKI